MPRHFLKFGDEFYVFAGAREPLSYPSWLVGTLVDPMDSAGLAEQPQRDYHHRPTSEPGETQLFAPSLGWRQSTKGVHVLHADHSVSGP